MTRQNIGVGATANDGSGDTLRQTGTKINANFVELYNKLGGDSDVLSGRIAVTSDGLQFEGSAVDDFETSLTAVNPTADRAITLPDASGEVLLSTAAQTVTNKTLTNAVLSNIGVGNPTLQINDYSNNHKYSLITPELAANHNIRLPILTDSDSFIFAATNQTLTNKTLTSATLVTPKLSNRVDDVNGAEILEVEATASAVNHVKIKNSVTGSGAQVSVAGDDTNISLLVGAKGNGSVVIAKNAYGTNTQTASGVASLLATYIIANSGSAMAISLSNGTVGGEYKIFTNKGAGITTITPTNFAQGTTIALDQHDTTTLIWDGANWNLLAQHGATVA